MSHENSCQTVEAMSQEANEKASQCKNTMVLLFRHIVDMLFEIND